MVGEYSGPWNGLYFKWTCYDNNKYITNFWSGDELLVRWPWGPSMPAGPSSAGFDSYEAYSSLCGDLEVIANVNQYEQEEMALFSIDATYNGENVYSNIEGIKISKQGEHKITISDKIPAESEVTITPINEASNSYDFGAKKTVTIKKGSTQSISFEGKNKTDSLNRKIVAVNKTAIGIGEFDYETVEDKIENSGFELWQGFYDRTIHDCIVNNNSESYYVKAKVYVPSTYSFECLSEEWTQDNGYYCYESELEPENLTNELRVRIDGVPEFDVTNQEFNVFVVYEVTKVQ